MTTTIIVRCVHCRLPYQLSELIGVQVRAASGDQPAAYELVCSPCRDEQHDEAAHDGLITPRRSAWGAGI